MSAKKGPMNTPVDDEKNFYENLRQLWTMIMYYMLDMKQNMIDNNKKQAEWSFGKYVESRSPEFMENCVDFHKMRAFMVEDENEVRIILPPQNKYGDHVPFGRSMNLKDVNAYWKGSKVF